MQFYKGNIKIIRVKTPISHIPFVSLCAKGILMVSINQIIQEKGGVVTKDELSSVAEYKRVLRAVERGDVVRLRQGVYAEPTAMLNTMVDVERIVPDGVVCLYNAWAYYQLSTTIPPGFCIAIDAKRTVTLPSSLPIQLYYWKKEYLEIGVKSDTISSYEVKITDMERSVCDAVKYRNKIGLDVCTEVIRNYLRKPSKNVTRLMEYAKQLRVANVLKNYLEIAIE